MIWLPETQPCPPPFLPNRTQCPGKTFITWNSILHWAVPTWLVLPLPPTFSSNSEIPELCADDDNGGCPAAVLGSVAAATIGGSSSRMISIICDPRVELTDSSSSIAFTMATTVNVYGLPRNWLVIFFKFQLNFYVNRTRKWRFSNWSFEEYAFRFYIWIFQHWYKNKEALQQAIKTKKLNFNYIAITSLFHCAFTYVQE